MLEVELGVPDPNLKRAITETCNRIGHVRSVKVHRDPSPFALIEMAEREQTYEVAARYGGSAFGTSALVHLVAKAA